VALTFDDGPGPDTLQIASTLKADGVKRATFFDTGQHDTQYPSVVRQVVAMGYLIGDHSWDHNYPRQVRGGWTVSYLRDQIGRTAREQQSLTGERTCYFRPPGGFMTNVLRAAHQLGMSVVLWNVDSLDWQQPSHLDPAFVARIVRDATTLTINPAHPIVLMHAARALHEPTSVASPYRSNTIAALPRVIGWYRDHGYTFVDLSARS
jgi:peptidoglycan/xylan/chitin deacetylase (PgdA/CDA1 family)